MGEWCAHSGGPALSGLLFAPVGDAIVGNTWEGGFTGCLLIDRFRGNIDSAIFPGKNVPFRID